MTAPASHYTRAFAALHWIMAALIIAVIAVMEAREFIPKTNELRATLKSVHFSLGLLVPLFLVARIGMRATTAVPPILPRPAAWQTGVSHFMHLALYLMMLGLPLLGWLALSGLGKSILFFGIALPPLMAEEQEFGHLLEQIHTTAGEAMIWLIALHAGAALVHHFVTRDNTLTRMSLARSGPTEG